MKPIALAAVFLLSLAAASTPLASGSQIAEAERLVESWVALWISYDLDRVNQLFLQDSRVTYFSSEKEGRIRGIDAIRDHHRGFGFVPGGRKAEKELWVEDMEADELGDALVVTAIWFFGDRSKPAAENQRGPMTMVFVRDGGEYRIAHLHFGNYGNRAE
jgi:ketosteroid isomerase-like protein